MAVTLQIIAAVVARVEFFHTIEFYVVATVVAAAVIVLSTRPASTKPVQTRFARASFEPDTDDLGGEPMLEVVVRNDGMVVFTRHGFGRVREETVVALAITIKGFDVTLKERVTAASSPAESMYEGLEGRESEDTAGRQYRGNVSAVFALDFFAPEWYHIQYINEHDGRFAAFTLHVRPGIHTRRPFKQ